MNVWIRFLIVAAAGLAADTANAFAPTATAKRRNAVAFGPLHSFGGLRKRLFGSRRRKRKGLVSSAPENITEEQVRDLFHHWNDALGSSRSSAVAETYADDAVLIPTSLNRPRMGRASIQAYFERVVERNPSVTILDGTIKMGHGWATNVGMYEWHFGDDGSRKEARYTFVYVYTDDDGWKISHHHSSALPEG